jgi:SAM-dependent methyltransferase
MKNELANNPSAVLAQVTSAEPTESPAQCPVCSAAIAVGGPIGTAGRYSLHECSACGIQFWNPFERIGSSWYEDFYKGRLQNIPPLEPGHKFFLADSRAPTKASLFDIGCGVGNFLAAARAQGFDVTGIDWDTKAIQTGKEILGLDKIFALSIEEYAEKNSGETFDVVSFFEVLEHQDDPAGFLSQVRRLVKPGGYIALSVPNRNRFQKGLDTTDLPPNHLTRWNPNVLTAFLRSHGFEIVSCREELLSLRRTATMLSAAMPTGLARAVLGGAPPNSTEVAENPRQARVTWQKQARFGRDRITSVLVRCKNDLFFLPALLCWPFLRAKGYPGIYLYCLAQRKD